MRWKAFDLKSWAALLSCLTRIKGAADENSSAVSGLGEDFAALSELTARELAGKQDKLDGVLVTIPADGWDSDSTETYPKYYDIAATGITASDRASVDIAPASMSTAVACGLCQTTETLDGKIRIRAVSVPTASMTANYWIEKGA